MRLKIYELKSIRWLLVQDKALPPPPVTTPCRLGMGEDGGGGSLKYCLSHHSSEISWDNKNTINNEFPRCYRFKKASACPAIKSQSWSHWGSCFFPQPPPPPYPSTMESFLQRSGQAQKETLCWCGPEQRSGGRHAEPANQPAQAEQACTSLRAE